MAWFIAFSSFLIAIMLYRAVDPSYSIFTNYLSDLGTGKNFSNIIFSLGLTLTEIFLILFYLCLGKAFKNENYNANLTNIAVLVSIISSISLILVIPFLTDPTNLLFSIMHGILANIHFIGMTIAFIFYGIIEISISRTNPLRMNKLIIISFSSALLYGLSCIFYNISIFYWIAIIRIFIWVLVHIIFLIKF